MPLFVDEKVGTHPEGRDKPAQALFMSDAVPKGFSQNHRGLLVSVYARAVRHDSCTQDRAPRAEDHAIRVCEPRDKSGRARG